MHIYITAQRTASQPPFRTGIIYVYLLYICHFSRQ